MPELEIKFLEDIPEYGRWLIYGDKGSGKTTLASGAPSPIWIDFENSSEALRKINPKMPIMSKPKDWDELIKWVPTAPSKGYETIVVDTITSMNDLWLIKWMKDPKVAKRVNYDRHIAQQYDFRKMTNVLKEFFYTLIDLPINVILIAHEKYYRDEESGKVLEIRPSLPPGAEEAVEKLIDEVYYLARKTKLGKNEPDDRILTVDSSGRILAKNRRGLKQKQYTNPTWELITNA